MRFIKKEDGQGMIEYALLLVLIAVVVIGILSVLGPRVRSTFGKIITAFGGAGGFEYAIISGPSIRAVAGFNSCSIRIDQLSVKVSDLGEPVDNGTVTVHIAWPGGGDSRELQITQNGVANFSGQEVGSLGSNCSSVAGANATVKIVNDGSTTTTTIH